MLRLKCLDDMEDQEEILDRRLLARLCLVREEVRWLSLEQGFTAPSSSSRAPRDEDSEGDVDGGEEAEGGSRSGRAEDPSDEHSTASNVSSRFARANVPQRPAAFIHQLVSVPDPSMRVALISRYPCPSGSVLLISNRIYRLCYSVPACLAHSACT